MNRLTNWTTLAAGAIVAVGLSVLPAGAQEVRQDVQDIHRDRADVRQDTRDIREDRRDIRQDTRDIRSDKQDIAKDTREIHQDRGALRGARQQMRDAYKSGDPAAIKAARENLQKTRSTLRGDLKERRGDVRDLHQDRRDRRADLKDLHQDKQDRRADERDVHQDRRELRRDVAARRAKQ